MIRLHSLFDQFYTDGDSKVCTAMRPDPASVCAVTAVRDFCTKSVVVVVVDRTS